MKKAHRNSIKITVGFWRRRRDSNSFKNAYNKGEARIFDQLLTNIVPYKKSGACNMHLFLLHFGMDIYPCGNSDIGMTEET